MNEYQKALQNVQKCNCNDCTCEDIEILKELIEEITEAHEQDRLGMSCDVETWLNLQECLINTLKQRKEEG